MSVDAAARLPGQPPATSGEVLFARYAYPPNELGYCGPGDGQGLIDLAAGVGDQDVGTRASCFDGAWPYLEIIASATGLNNPLDPRVVEAYWVGNSLLDAVDPRYFAEAAGRRFASQTGADWRCLDPGHPVPATPHHSFHVFAVYPWMGMLRAGHVGPALTVLDRCRIRWGQVTTVNGDRLDVHCRSLTWDGQAISLGEMHEETLRWAASGRSLSGEPIPGEWVSLHWDWVCDRLAPAQVAALQHYTNRQIEVSNRRC